jgi:hypothetical protein
MRPEGGFGMEMSLGGWKCYDVAEIEYHNMVGFVIRRMVSPPAKRHKPVKTSEASASGAFVCAFVGTMWGQKTN